MQKLSRTLQIALCLVLLLTPLAGWGQGSEWKWLTGGKLNAVKFIGQHGWIIGDDGNQGIILHTTNGGDTWAIQPHNTGKHYFRGLSFCDSLNGFIVGGFRSMGEPGFILKTSDGGQSWTLGTSPTTYNLNRVCFINAQYGWMTTDTSAIFRTTDGGNTWEGDSVNGGYQGIDFVDSMKGFAVSGAGIFHIVITTDGGRTWILKQDNTKVPTSSIDMADSARGWTCGLPNAVILTTDGWQTWTQIPCGGGGFLNDISFHDTLNGFMVGGENNHSAQYYKTTDGGLTWAVDSLTKNWDFFGVDAKQYPDAWIAGDGGSVLKTTTSGNTWTVIRNADISYDKSLTNTFFKDVNRGWAVGTYGVITHTTNGGTIWQLQKSGTSNFLYGVDFPDPQKGWTCGDGGMILGTTNAGTSWDPETSNATGTLFAIDFVDTTFGVSVGGYYAKRDFGNVKTDYSSRTTTQTEDTLRPWGTGLDFWKWPWRPEEATPQTAYRAITRTTNGGALWIAQNTSGQVPLYGVSFVTQREGWACGDPQGGMGVILHTTDSGATWTGQASNVNQPLNWIQFRNSQNGWCVGSGGTALWTTNGGTTWNQGNTGTTAPLWSCAFYDAMNGFACGNNGLLIKTVDGGRNWSPDTSKVYANLTAVNALDSLHAWSVGSYGMVLGWRLAGVSGVENRVQGFEGSRVQGVKAYPNPFVSYARVPGHERERFALYDITGRRVGTYKGDRIGADAAAGIYFLMAEGKEGRPTRIVKVR